jgi:hypothetical protein
MSDQKTVEELQAELEAASAQINDLKKAGGLTDEEKARLAHIEAENKELIAARDKAKQKAREAEEARLKEEGEFKTLAEQKQAEAEKLAKDIEEKNSILEKYKERDKQELETLLKEVPETLRESIADDSLPLSKQLELAKKLVAEKPKGPGARPAGELTTDSLEEQLRQAQKDGDVAASIRLKREIFESKQ